MSSNEYFNNNAQSNCPNNGYPPHQQQYQQGYQSSNGPGYDHNNYQQQAYPPEQQQQQQDNQPGYFYNEYPPQQQHYQQYQQTYSTYSSHPSYMSPAPVAESQPVGRQYGYDSDNTAAYPPADSYNPHDTPSDEANSGNPGHPAAYNQPQYQRQELAQPAQHPYGAPVNDYPYPPYSAPTNPPYDQSRPYQPPQQGHQQHMDQPPQYNEYRTETNPQSPYQPEDAEKGIMGALAGGAAGAYAGHKVNHGFIGAAGGAYAGSKLEDHVKNDNDKTKQKKEKKDKKKALWKRRGSNSSSSSSSSSSDDDDEKKKPRLNPAIPPPHHHEQQKREEPLAGNFSASCTNITLDADYDLIASCRSANGTTKLSSISLNSVLANMSGEFSWAKGGNFGASAREVRLVEEGKVLEAELGDGGATLSGWGVRRVRLDERISNEDGELVFLG